MISPNFTEVKRVMVQQTSRSIPGVISQAICDILLSLINFKKLRYLSNKRSGNGCTRWHKIIEKNARLASCRQFNVASDVAVND